MFLQRAESCSLPISRDAFLLAMQEVASPMISTKKINMALAAQTVFLEKLKKFLQDDLTETDSKIKGDGNVDTILEKQQKRLQGEVNFISKCVDLLKTEPIPTDYELNLNKSRAGKTITFCDLKNGFDTMPRRLVFSLWLVII